MLNLNQLAQFLSIARTGSLAAASEEIGVSSAALSKSLAALERQLGTKLFDRVGRGLQLTRVGENLVDQAAELLGHVDRLSADLRTSADGSAGTLVIGCGPAALQGPVSRLVRRLMEGASQLQPQAGTQLSVRIQSGSTSDLLEHLRQYRLDFVVADASNLPLSPEIADYRVSQLSGFGVQLAVSRTHPLAGRPTLTLAEVLEYPWVTPSVPAGMRQALRERLSRESAPSTAFARLATVPDVQIEDLNSCLQVAAQSPCVAATLLSEATDAPLPGTLCILPVALGITTQIAVIALKGRTPSPLAARAMSLLTGSA